MSGFDFLVNKSDLGQTALDEISVPTITEGEVLLEINRFALTANNITYGVAGDFLGYWKFFEARDGLGKIPVWGIGTVVASNTEGVTVGERYYGYYPMSSHLVTIPGKISKNGFSDMAERRQSLSPVYNQYAKMTEDNGYPKAHDNYQVIYRPLFTTSFVLDDYFFDNGFFGAEQIILSSASSKTSFGMAYQLRGRGLKVIGLTSENNKAFVAGLGLYDQVVTYDEIEAIEASVPSAYVDMSGNKTVLAKIHHHLADNLKASCGVGITHWDAQNGEDPSSLPGAKPTMFFAPDQIQKRNKECGGSEFQAKLATAWNSFIADVETWVEFEETLAPDNLTETYETVLAGPAPNKAYVLTLQ